MAAVKRLKIGVLLSGSGSNLRAIMDACEDDRIDGDVVFVGSDVPGVKGLTRATVRHIPTFVVDYKQIGRNITGYADLMKTEYQLDQLQTYIRKSMGIVPPHITEPDKRVAWLYKRIVIENELLREIEKYEFDLLALAGFMRNFTAFFIDQINTDPSKPRITNIHPAYLPAFPGTNGYEDTFNNGCKVGASTVHFVDYGEDTGPIIDQITFPVFPGEKFESFKNRGLEQEWILYPRCIQLYAEDRLRVVEGVNGKRIVQIS